MDPELTCKGAWSLGTACGECERCRASAPSEVRRLMGVISEMEKLPFGVMEAMEGQETKPQMSEISRPMHPEDIDCPAPPTMREKFVLHIMAGLLNGQVTVKQAQKAAIKEQWFFYDRFHHAPRCPANTWSGMAYPSPFCTCGARTAQIS